MLESYKLKAIATNIIKKCGITLRHVAVDHSTITSMECVTTFGAPSLNERTELFQKFGVDLGCKVAEMALKSWGGDRAKITHLFTYSNCGLPGTGLDLRLMKSLRLPATTKHNFVTYMGCHMGMLGLRLAAETAMSDPRNRVLVVCSEVNSANIQQPDPADPINNIIANIIFADGAAGMVIGCEPSEAETAIFQVHDSSSVFVPDSDNAILAQLSSRGFDVGLKKTLPGMVKSCIDSFARQLVGPSLHYSDLLWAVHPGGKTIVDAVEEGCHLDKGTLDVSRYVLDNHANMASPTIVFVLDKLRKDNSHLKDKWTLAIGFGPGLSVEGMLLKLV